MRALIAVAAVGALLYALPGAGAADRGDPGAAAAAKPCAKHKKKKHPPRHHKRRRHRRHCRGSGAPGAGPGSGPGSGTAKCPSDSANPGRVAAKESEYQIVLSRPSVACGTTIVEQDNNGMDPHDLVLQKVGDSSPSYAFGELGPGGVAKKTLELGKGNWTLFCSISDHRARGMEVNLVVD
jgi:hypothetical protein